MERTIGRPPAQEGSSEVKTLKMFAWSGVGLYAFFKLIDVAPQWFWLAVAAGYSIWKVQKYYSPDQETK